MLLIAKHSLRNLSRILSKNPPIHFEALFNHKRTIMTTGTKMEKFMEELKTNPYYNKYAEKIVEMQKISPEEFLQRIDAKEQALKEKDKAKDRRFHKAPQPKSSPSTMQCTAKKLDDIMKTELIKDKSREEISSIWTKYHKKQDCVAGVLTSDQYAELAKRGQKYSTFLLPLPRDNGYEFIVLQFHGTEVHMTPLLWYQTHKENAPECMTIYHFTELMDDKGIVLMRGEFDKNSLNVQEAQCLANELQLYYGLDDVKRVNLLETFTNRPDEFKHMDLVAQLEYISLDTRKPKEKK